MAKTPPHDKPLHVRTSRGPRFAPGHKRLGGRPPGQPNKVSQDAKLLMDELVEHGLTDAIKVYDRLKKKSPEGALKALARLAEFRLPKLQRSEISGPNGEPVRTMEVVEYVTTGSRPPNASGESTPSSPKGSDTADHDDEDVQAPGLSPRFPRVHEE